MRLKKFDKDKKQKQLKKKLNSGFNIKKRSLILSVFILLSAIIYFTFARFESSNSFNLINSKVGDFSGDVKILSYTYNNKTNDEPPKIDDGYVFKSADCTNASARWNHDTWELILGNVTGKVKCNLTFEKPFSQANIESPELYKGMIPVTINNTNGTIKVADITESWFSYIRNYYARGDMTANKWANAVLVDNPSEYLGEDNHVLPSKVGETISMNKIKQMYVWIPRYAYKLFNTNSTSNAKYIDVTTQLVNEKSSGSQDDELLTHPAFTFGSEELPGIWVGKFETSYTQSVSSNFGCSTTNCSEVKNILIKPNQVPLLYQNVSSMFYLSKSISSNNNFGLDSSEVDVHMMKNTEWGAVALLSNSKLGPYYEDGSLLGISEIYPNTNSSMLTGYSAAMAFTTSSTDYHWYHSSNGGKSSVSRSVYGVYDMSGGLWEAVMANVSIGSSYTYMPGNSGLSSKPQDKYINTYYASDSKDFSHAIKGDLMNETVSNKSGPTCWNSDTCKIVSENNYWIKRGGSKGDGAAAGVFAFDSTTGNDPLVTFRVVITRATQD